MNIPMRQRLLLDRNWRFALGHAAEAAKDFEYVRDRSLVKAGEARGAASPKFDDSAWRPVDLPHDWAVELPFDPASDKELCDHGFRAIGPQHPEHSVGWYRRTFHIPASDLDRRIRVEFEGVFRDSVVWINGHRMGRHASGYTSFGYDLTECLNYGGENVLVVRADASMYEGWWYEGAGIYRHTWLVKTAPLHIAPCGVFVSSTLWHGRATVTVRTEILNAAYEHAECVLESSIIDARGRCVALAASQSLFIGPRRATECVQQLRPSQSRPWSIEDPYLYRLRSRVLVGDRAVDVQETRFGIRRMEWDANYGFYLNGRPVTVKGFANHEDHAGVGVAVPDRIHEMRIARLKGMGCNAYRCAHNPASPALLDACDRLGMLVLCENRVAGTGPEVLEDLASLVRRDRNHPCVIAWSLANEEHTVQWADAGERIGRTMKAVVRRLDPTRPVTAAVHEVTDKGFVRVVDVQGWNYIRKGDIDAFHADHPDRPILGTEECSVMCTRGIYENDAARGYVSAYDLNVPSWGVTAETWWTFFSARPWLAGGFAWTGYDHRGEPVKYKWPNIASHFGIMDLCGFPKDHYWYYKAWWQDRPVLHLLPHWTWPGREGQVIDVRCYSNCDQVELRLNGRSLGRRAILRNSHAAWMVAYEPGILEAIGRRGRKVVARCRRETAGPAAALRLHAERSTIDADGADVSCVRVSALDAAGREVPTADHLVLFQVTGAGRLLGVGNGDPSSHESDKEPQRRLFGGLALAIVQSTMSAGTIELTASSDGLRPARISIRARRRGLRPAIE